MYWNVFHLSESYFLQNFSLLLVIIFSWTLFFGGFCVVLVWSVNCHYISKNKTLKKCNQQKNQSFTLLAQCAQLLPKSAWLRMVEFLKL